MGGTRGERPGSVKMQGVGTWVVPDSGRGADPDTGTGIEIFDFYSTINLFETLLS